MLSESLMLRSRCSRSSIGAGGVRGGDGGGGDDSLHFDDGGPQVYRMSGSGGGATRVTKKGKYNQSPDWNHGKGRGQWLVYAGRDSSNRYEVFKVDTKSGKTQKLTQSPGRNLDPSWSPDGRYVAYSRGGGIYIMNEEGLNNIQIARGASTPDWGPRSGN